MSRMKLPKTQRLAHMPMSPSVEDVEKPMFKMSRHRPGHTDGTTGRRPYRPVHRGHGLGPGTLKADEEFIRANPVAQGGKANSADVVGGFAPLSKIFVTDLCRGQLDLVP
jgi:hypothetical protein